MALTLYKISTTNKLVVTDNSTPPFNGVAVSSPASSSLADMSAWYKLLDTSYTGWTPNEPSALIPEIYNSNPTILIINSTAQAFTFNGLDVLSPASQTITFTLTKQNILDPTVWSTISDVGLTTNLLTSTTEISAVLTSASFGTNEYVQVTATCGNEVDEFTIMRLTDGATVLLGYLTNETHSVPASNIGATTAPNTFAAATGTFKVFYGLTEVTNSCTFAGTVNNCTASVVTVGTTGRGVYAVTAMTSSTTDTATYTMVATHPTYGSVTKVFTVTKSKAGVSPYLVVIESTNGDEFRIGQSKQTTLIAHVFQDNNDVTASLDASQFKWRRVSMIDNPPPNNDAAWNNLYTTGYKTVTVDVDAVYSKATFFCDIYSLT